MASMRTAEATSLLVPRSHTSLRPETQGLALGESRAAVVSVSLPPMSGWPLLLTQPLETSLASALPSRALRTAHS